MESEITKMKWITQEGYYLFVVSSKFNNLEKIGYRDATDEEIKRFGERLDKQQKERKKTEIIEGSDDQKLEFEWKAYDAEQKEKKEHKVKAMREWKDFARRNIHPGPAKKIIPLQAAKRALIKGTAEVYDPIHMAKNVREIREHLEKEPLTGTLIKIGKVEGNKK